MSVWEQRGVSAELIVVDGGSNDGSVVWLELNRAKISTLISGPDHGVYDAMNKGIAAAHGDWVLFLGADDELSTELALSEILPRLQQTAGGVVAGEILYRDGRVYRLSSAPRPIARNFVHHQGAFYRRTLFAENGGFDTSFAIMADYEFNLRLWKSHIRFRPASLRIAVCGTHGLSDAGRWQGYREEIRARHRHFAAWKCWWWDVLSVVRFFRKQIIR